MDGLGEPQLEHLGLQTALQEVIQTETPPQAPGGVGEGATHSLPRPHTLHSAVSAILPFLPFCHSAVSTILPFCRFCHSAFYTYRL